MSRLREGARRLGPGSRPAGAGLWFFALHLWTVFGLALSNLFFGLALLAAPRALARSAVDWRGARLAVLPLVAYAALTLSSIAASYDPAVSFSTARGVLLLATFFLALLFAGGETRVRWVVDGLVLLGGLLAVVGLAQLALGFGDIHHRIRGPFSHYMTFAGVLLLVDLLLIAQMVFNSAWRSWWRWIVLLAVNAALLASLTRSAWLALAATVTVMLVIRAPKLLLAYLPAALLVAWLAPRPVVERIVSIADLQDISNYDRVCMAQAGLYMVRERPLLGIGPGMVAERYPLYRHPTAPRARVPHLHNTFLQIAAEQGVPALLAYLAFMVSALWAAFRGYRRELAEGGGRADLYIGAFLALLAFNLAGQFEDNWRDSEVQRLALFVLAMPYCLGERAGVRGAEEEEAGALERAAA